MRNFQPQKKSNMECYTPQINIKNIFQKVLTTKQTSSIISISTNTTEKYFSVCPTVWQGIKQKRHF
jgi:hypothetical protein